MINFAAQKTYALFQTPNNKKLIADLKNRGAKVLEFPPLETVGINANEKSAERLKNLTQFDWIIFPDAFAVNYFLHRLEENSIDFFELDDLRVCAFGEAVSDCLRFVQLHADVIPNSIEPQTVFKAITDYIGGVDLNNFTFLFPRENSSKYELTNLLKNAGAEISEFPVYQINSVKTTEVTKLKVLLEGGAVDEFIFSTAEDVFALNFYFSGEIEDLKKEVKTSAVGDVAFQSLKEYGFKPRLFHFDKEN